MLSGVCALCAILIQYMYCICVWCDGIVVAEILIIMIDSIENIINHCANFVFWQCLHRTFYHVKQCVVMRRIELTRLSSTLVNQLRNYYASNYSDVRCSLCSFVLWYFYGNGIANIMWNAECSWLFMSLPWISSFVVVDIVVHLLNCAASKSKHSN